MDISALVAIIIALLLIGFFSGIEIAFISANRLSIELNRKQGSYSGKLWGKLADHPTRFIATTLLAFNLVLVLYGLLVGGMLAPVWRKISSLFSVSEDNLGYIKLLVETVLSTVILLVVEFFSKAFFRAQNKQVLSNGMIAVLINFVYNLLSSLASVFVKASEWILKYILNVKISDKKEIFSKVDLEHLVQQNKSYYEEDTADLNKELFEKALSLGDTKLRACLVPRKEVVGVDLTTNIAGVKAKFIETRLSKLVVFEHNIDSIAGYVHQLDLFKNPDRIEEILLPIPTVPESMSATALMNKFAKDRKSIAWVIDEFGGTAGIVTMEDLLEEIFGEIKDEYDDIDEFIEKQISETEYIFSGRLELDYISEKYKLHFEAGGEAETLSGYIIQNHEDIPKQNQRIFVANYEFTVLTVSGTRIETVKIRQLN